MSTSRVVKYIRVAVVVAVLAGVLVLAWFATRSGPMAFVAQKAVTLEAYDGHPTGVPADLQNADAV
ncbi:MAG TPA: hypothetical protein VGO53_04190, partial [Steroidobacteraceae bacterium]|nr:hypothetical protein [Steroidobacteraceae bacterium]